MEGMGEFPTLMGDMASSDMRCGEIRSSAK